MTKIYQFKISLIDSDPLIWRRVLVEDSSTLSDLHAVIQRAMGWENCHLYEFVHRKEHFTFDGEDSEDLSKQLSSFNLRKGSKLLYMYDFGDDWGHLLKLEKILDQENEGKYPRCIEGERACPPEDSGGIFGYEGMLETLRDTESEGYEELLEWMGEDFDSEHFDINEVNQELADLQN